MREWNFFNYGRFIVGTRDDVSIDAYEDIEVDNVRTGAGRLKCLRRKKIEYFYKIG
jgi:hypothetical protein